MKSTDIILWTISLTLAVTGILFGIIASWNSSKANRRISELISASWITEEAQKFFFDNIKIVMAQNKKTITKLKRNKEATYYEYSIQSALGRLIPISKKTKVLFENSEYKEISEIYEMIKKTCDVKFRELFNDYSILSTDEVVSQDVVSQLINYHKDVVDKVTHLLKQYNLIISGTKEVSTNKL